jgi:hypothetical protein
MVNYNSPFAGLGKILLIVILLTAVACLALSDSDVFNLITNSVKAKTQYEKDAIDLQYYRELKAAETNAAVNKVNTDSSLYEERMKDGIAFYNTTRLIVVVVIALIVTGFAFLLITSLFRKWNPPAELDREQIDYWQDPQIRAREILKAREMERISRSSKVNGQIPLYYSGLNPQISSQKRQPAKDQKFNYPTHVDGHDHHPKIYKLIKGG